MTAGGAAAGAGVAGGTAVLAPSAPPAAAPPMGGGRGRSQRMPGGDAGGGRDVLPLWMRVGVWVVALPLGLAIVGVPARGLGYLSSQKLLDVIVKRDITRFVPIIVIVALWALVSAVLVTVLVEGGRRYMLSRRGRKAQQRESPGFDDSFDGVSGRGSRRGRGGRRVLGRRR